MTSCYEALRILIVNGQLGGILSLLKQEKVSELVVNDLIPPCQSRRSPGRSPTILHLFLVQFGFIANYPMYASSELCCRVRDANVVLNLLLDIPDCVKVLKMRDDSNFLPVSYALSSSFFSRHSNLRMLNMTVDAFDGDRTTVLSILRDGRNVKLHNVDDMTNVSCNFCNEDGDSCGYFPNNDGAGAYEAGLSFVSFDPSALTDESNNNWMHVLARNLQSKCGANFESAYRKIENLLDHVETYASVSASVSVSASNAPAWTPLALLRKMLVTKNKEEKLPIHYLIGKKFSHEFVTEISVILRLTLEGRTNAPNVRSSKLADHTSVIISCKKHEILICFKVCMYYVRAAQRDPRFIYFCSFSNPIDTFLRS